MATTDPPSCADAGGVVYLAVVPDSGSPFHRAHHGEVGRTRCLTPAGTVRQVIAEDADAACKRAIVAVAGRAASRRVPELLGRHGNEARL